MDELVRATLSELEAEARVTAALVRGVVFGLRLVEERQLKRELGALVRAARELHAECAAASQSAPEDARLHVKKARRAVYQIIRLLDVVRPAAPVCFGLSDIERRLGDLHNLTEYLA
jgi:hypothetical protein